MDKLTICNIALSRVTAPRMQAITDATREARECNLIYDFNRDLVLSEYDWTFARESVALALDDDASATGWDLAYSLPADCLAPRRLYNALGDDAEPIPFEIRGRVLFTNEIDAELIYTKRVTDATKYDAAFSDALAWRLAADLAVPLKNSLTLQQNRMQMYQMSIGKASAKNTSEEVRIPSDTNSFSDARDC